jgi:hypothetical protein
MNQKALSSHNTIVQHPKSVVDKSNSRLYPFSVDRWMILWIPRQRAKRGEPAEPEISDVNKVKAIEE